LVEGEARISFTRFKSFIVNEAFMELIIRVIVASYDSFISVVGIDKGKANEFKLSLGSFID